MIKTKLFGTDGIRNKIDTDILSISNVARLGQVLAVLINGAFDKKRVFIAYDTRASGVYLGQALMSGLISMGVDVEDLGILTTPALAYITKAREANLGIMISASHNQAGDNGFKIFDSRGFKLGHELERTIEEIFFSSRCFNPDANKIGTYKVSNYRKDYISFLLGLKLNFSELKRLRLVIDCANGAATYLTKELFSFLDADVMFINDAPDGRNINANCGSEHPDGLIKAVLHYKADVGIAFDGDADRVIFIDSDGEKVDGDAILHSLAVELSSKKQLNLNTLVSTVMSSKGLELGLMKHGIKSY